MKAAETRPGRLRNWALMLLVNLMWAAQYPAYSIAARGMGVAALNFWTFLIAALCLLPFRWRDGAKRETHEPRRGGIGSMILLAAGGLIPPSVILAWGVAHASAANGAILSLTVPVMMVVMARPILGERPNRHFVVSLFLALLGTCAMSWGDIRAGSLTGSTALGNAALLLGNAGSAFYNAYGKRLMNSWSELDILVIGYLFAAAMCAVLALASGNPAALISAPTSAWMGVAVLGLLSWGLAMRMWMWLLARLQLIQMSVSVYILPVFGVILSSLTLGEQLSWYQTVGAVIVLASALMASAEESGPPTSELQSEAAVGQVSASATTPMTSR